MALAREPRPKNLSDIDQGLADKLIILEVRKALDELEHKLLGSLEAVRVDVKKRGVGAMGGFRGCSIDESVAVTEEQTVYQN